MLRYKTETRLGLVVLYDIRPGNGAGPFLQPRSPHGATDPERVSSLFYHQKRFKHLWTAGAVFLHTGARFFLQAASCLAVAQPSVEALKELASSFER